MWGKRWGSIARARLANGPGRARPGLTPLLQDACRYPENLFEAECIPLFWSQSNPASRGRVPIWILSHCPVSPTVSCWLRRSTMQKLVRESSRHGHNAGPPLAPPDCSAARWIARLATGQSHTCTDQRAHGPSQSISARYSLTASSRRSALSVRPSGSASASATEGGVVGWKSLGAATVPDGEF